MKILCSNPLAQYDKYNIEIKDAINDVLSSGRYILGDQVESLEKEFARYLDINHVVGVANGTDALEIVLRALGIGYGDEVITVSHTAVATVAAIECVGAIPVLTDINLDNFTIDVEKVCELINDKTKAIIPVHLYGRGVDIFKLKEICESRKIHLIEDCSQAHGLRLNQNNRAGTIGIAGCFSCYPTKNLGGIGDAGLISTNSDELAAKIRSLRQYGWEKRNNSQIKGRNSRLDEIQAAILRVKLKYLDENNTKRKKIAQIYYQQLAEFDLILPNFDCFDHVFHLYVIRFNQREKLKRFLNSKGIAPGIHYPLPIHKQSIYLEKIKTCKSMKNTEKASKEILSLPMYPELKIDELDYIISVIKNYFQDF